MSIIRLLIISLFCCAWVSTAEVQADIAADTQARNTALPDYATLHRLLANEQEPMMWLFVGDSITHGCLHTHGFRSFAEHWMELVKWEYRTERGSRRTNDIVLNTAVSGETAAGFLHHAEWRLKQFKAHVVFINFGINDGTRKRGTDNFRADLQQIIELVRQQGAIPVLQTPSLTLAGEAYRPLYAAAVRQVAEEQQVLLVDHTAAWVACAGKAKTSAGGGAASVPAPRELMNDNLHPNSFGHRLMAQTIARHLGITPQHSPTLKLPLQ